MRLAELLAIVAVCPLAIVGSGCPRIEQPIGQYSAASTKSNGRNGTGSQASPGTGTQDDTDGMENLFAIDASAGSANSSESVGSGHRLPDPVLPSDGSSSSAPAASGTGRTPPSSRDTCFTGSVLATRKPLDMYIVMDANVTLPYSGSWEVATTGVRMFVQDSAAAGIGVGLRYFGNECEPEPYDTNPTVEVGVLPDNQDKLVAGTKMPANNTSSPMLDALKGGIMHQLKRAQAHSDRKQIVVLVSDGFTQDLMCRYSLQDVQDAATNGFTRDIQTYVIGFGAPDTMSAIADDILARFSVLNGIARDGGGRAFSVKFNDDPDEMHKALTTIRRDAQPCAYDFPSGEDPTHLNLSLEPNYTVPRVDNREACGQTTPGFYYAYTEGSDTPSSVELCPASCWLLGTGDYAAVFYKGCPTDRP